MGIEIVGNEDPRGLRVSLDGTLNMFSTVSFGTGNGYRRTDDQTGGYLKVGRQTECAMTTILRLLAFGTTWRYPGNQQALQGLDTGLLVKADNPNSLAMELSCLLVECTDLVDLRSVRYRISWLVMEPVGYLVRLERGLVLKNDQRW